MRARRQHHLIGVPEIERDVRGRLIAGRRILFEAAQDDVLQRRRHVLVDCPRRDGVAPQAVTHAGEGLRLAERLLAGSELVEHHPQRIQIAARIAAIVLQLLR